LRSAPTYMSRLLNSYMRLYINKDDPIMGGCDRSNNLVRIDYDTILGSKL